MTSWKNITDVLAADRDWKAGNAVCSDQLTQRCLSPFQKYQL